jgi:hypothetical protein
MAILIDCIYERVRRSDVTRLSPFGARDAPKFVQRANDRETGLRKGCRALPVPLDEGDRPL